MRILVIDDEMSICRFLKRFLTKEGHEVDTFLNGQEALDAFEPKKFNRALVDINLGKGLDGIQVAQELRSKDPNLRIVLISGDPANIARVKQANFDQFIQKPFDLSKLKSIL